MRSPVGVRGPVADGPVIARSISSKSYVFVELIGEDGAPVAPGEPGRVVVTSTEGRGAPFLRYDIGDVATCSAQGVTHRE